LRSPDLRPVYLLYADSRGFWMHCAHMSLIPGTDCFDLQSAYGYGGPVSDCDDPAFLGDVQRVYAEWCTESRVIVEFVRLHPLAAWQCYAGNIVPDRQAVWVNIAEEDFRARYEIRCRTAVR